MQSFAGHGGTPNPAGAPEVSVRLWEEGEKMKWVEGEGKEKRKEMLRVGDRY